jgi:hypothetical protein
MFDCDRAPSASGSPAAPAEPPMAADAFAECELLDRLRVLLLEEGGFTVDFHTARSVRVGLAVCADPTLTLRFRLHDWSDRRVLSWLRDCRRVVDVEPRPDLYLGGWHTAHSDHVYLDIVRVVPTEGQQVAEHMGRLHRQHALFDLARRALVPLVAT